MEQDISEAMAESHQEEYDMERHREESCCDHSEPDRIMGFCLQHPPDPVKVMVWIGCAYAALVVAKAVAW